MADMNISLVITASDQASGTLTRVGGSAQQMGTKVQGSIGPAVAAAAGAGILLAGKYVADFVAGSLEEFAQFETGMAEVFTVLPPMSEEAMGALEQQALDAAATMGVLPEEMIPALYQALSAGIPPDNVFEFLETANAAAIGGVTDLETAVDAISSVVNAYGEELVDATEASDLMFTASALGKTTFEELGASLFQVVPTAASLGVKFEDIAAALAVMTAQGVPTSVATTQLRQAMVELSKEGTAAADTFERVAGQSFGQFISEGGNLQEALAMMADEAQKTNVPVSNLFGSVEAGSAALTLTGDNARAFADAITKMETSAGATESAAGKFNDTIERTEDIIAAQTSELKILIAQGLEPTKRAWLDLKQVLVEAALEAAKEAKTRRERVAAMEEEEDAQRDVKAALEEWIETNDAAIQTSRGYVDEQEAIWEAIDTVNAAFDPYNGSLHDAAMNADALEAALELLEGGFEGTGAELGAAAIAVAEYNDAIDTMTSQTSTASLALTDQGQAQAWLTQNTEAARQAIIDSGPPLDGWMAGLVAAEVAAEELAVTEEQLVAHQTLINQYWAESGTAIEPLIAAYQQAEDATGQLIEIDGVWMTDHDAAALAIQEANGQVGESYRQMAADAILAEQGVSESTLNMLVSLGLLTPEAAALRWEFTQNSDIILNQLVPAFNAGKLTAEELDTAIGLLESGQADTAESAIAMAQAMNDDVTQAFRDAKAEAIALETPIRNIKAAADDTAGDYDINFNINQNGEIPTTPGYQGSSGAGYQAPPDGYALGGYTGDGGENEVAGFVHRGEYVLPPDVVDRFGVRGIEDIFFGSGGTGARGTGGGSSVAEGGINITIPITIEGNVTQDVYDRMEQRLTGAVERVMDKYGHRADVRLRAR